MNWAAFKPDKTTIDYWRAYCELVLVVLALVWIASRIMRGGLFPTLQGVATNKVPV